MTDAYSFAAGVQDVEELDTFSSALFYGPAGVGKTNLGASAIHVPGFERVLIVDIEGSATGVGRLNPGVKRIRAQSFSELEIIKRDLLANPAGVDLVIFDTVNAGGKLAIKHFQSLPENRANKFGAWGDLADWTNDWMRSFHHSSIPTVFIMHAQDVKNEQTGAITTVPKYQGSAQEDIPTIPDIVGYYNYESIDGKIERVLYVGEALGLVTKNRFGLPNKIVEPTMSKINQLIADAA